MNRGQPAQEVDDLEMASYTILETVDIRPFLGRTMPDVVHVKEQFVSSFLTFLELIVLETKPLFSVL